MHGYTCRYTAAEKVGILLWKLMGIKYLSGWVQMCLIQIVIFLFAASLSLMNDWSQRSAMINGSTLAPLHALLILLLYYPYNPAGCFALCTQAHTHAQARMYIFANTYTRCIMLLEVVEFFWSGKTNKVFHWLRMVVSVLLNALSGVSAEHQRLTTSLRSAIQFIWSENHILCLNWLRRRKHHYHQIELICKT